MMNFLQQVLSGMSLITPQFSFSLPLSLSSLHLLQILSSQASRTCQYIALFFVCTCLRTLLTVELLQDLKGLSGLDTAAVKAGKFQKCLLNRTLETRFNLSRQDILILRLHLCSDEKFCF